MFDPSVYGRPQANQPTPLDPKARDFAPASGNDSEPVLDATFFTHTIPDIPPDAHVVGLCTVPRERAGMDQLGYHIADFLAFKYLLHDDAHRGSQDWLAHCDVVSIVNANPNVYVHGKERRILLDAEGIGHQGTSYSHAADLKVQTDRQKLMADFVIACSVKAHLSKQSGTPLVIIVCGPTTVQQDVFFGETDAVHHLKSESICHAIGGDVETIMVTPAMFSAGWQVNPSFNISPVEVRANRREFLARQFGGVFTKAHMDYFIGTTCPFFVGDGMDMEEVKEKFSNPFLLSYQQREILADFKVTLHKYLAGRLSVDLGNHSFNFETELDDWEHLIGPRKYLSLQDYRKKWEKLGVSAQIVDNERFSFLGDAFGGSKKSQLSHLKHLIKESFESWPAYWELPASNDAKTTFKKLLDEQDVHDNFCHEIFSVLEHRATLAILGDITVRCLNIPGPTEERCRDWNEKVDFRSVAAPYNEIIDWIPGVHVPPGVNPDSHRAIQQYFDYPVFYLALAVVRQRTRIGGSMHPMTRRIHDFLEGVKHHQIELLCSIPEVEKKCVAWLKAIEMPIRRLGEDSAAVSQLEAPTQATIEDSETVLHDPQPQPSTQLQDILAGFISDGQSSTGPSIMRKTEAEIDDYLAKNSSAQVALTALLEKDSDKMLERLIVKNRRLHERLQEDPNDDFYLSMKPDLDHITQKFLIKVEKRRERAQPVASQQMPQAVGHQGPAHPNQEQQESQSPSWVPPHLRHKVRNVAEITKENNPGMTPHHGSSSHTESNRNQSTGNQPSALAPRDPEQRKKKSVRINA
ncbi:uncharacterized protein F4807DRAFT_346173 [Annulohypoxylon truncatum]|uniref:uncharacterized protein n=1 Tax=Annulohypoxylon truncatum TaxID=327061 RepID=UPI0020088489|nr:uncharacterized protein F4807DRAFT_346173 [Annulohypoxylon truncatum]KAI1212693.1 hypothetical protein F4807DRAFT_346173 [Annulohypoxylon truncatum]